MRDVIIQEIKDHNSHFFISKWVTERVPYVFDNDLVAYIQWKEKLSKLIKVDSKSIVLTGSSAVGISLNPHKNFKPFDDTSDIDIAIISSYYFDISWHYLRNIGTERFRFKPVVQNSIEEHRKRLIYWGTIATDEIVQILPFGIDWLKAMDEMKKVSPTLDKDINFRIYKDFEALRSYQDIAVNQLKDNLVKGVL